MLRKILILSVLPLLAGCLAQSRIQSKYMTQEASCRDDAQDRGAQLPNSNGTVNGGVQPSDTSYIVASSFSDCMHKAGWKVSTPKPPGATTTPVTVVTAPTTPPSGAPGPGGTVAAAKAAPILGPGVQPAPAPANTEVPQVTTVPAAPAPAAAVTAQPAAPAPAAQPSAPTTNSSAAVPASQAAPADSSSPTGVSVYQPAPADIPDYGRSTR